MLMDFPLCAVISWFFDLGSAFSGLVGKRLGDVWVGFECLSGLSLAARTNSAARVEAMEAVVSRFATEMLDGEIGAHLARAAVDTRVSISVTMPGYMCMFLCTSTVSEKECRARRSLGGSNSRP